MFDGGEQRPVEIPQADMEGRPPRLTDLHIKYTATGVAMVTGSFVFLDRHDGLHKSEYY